MENEGKRGLIFYDIKGKKKGGKEYHIQGFGFIHHRRLELQPSQKRLYMTFQYLPLPHRTIDRCPPAHLQANTTTIAQPAVTTLTSNHFP